MKRIPTNDLLQAIRDLNNQTRKTPPTKAQMNEFGEHSSRTYQLRFGSWNEAVAAAGFDPRTPIDEEFVERPDECPLCTQEVDELDFHHWRYGEKKQGCYLCRACHDEVHENGAMPSQDSDWLMQAVENLVRSHQRHHDNADVADIIGRYNVTSGKLVEVAISRVSQGGDQ